MQVHYKMTNLEGEISSNIIQDKPLAIINLDITAFLIMHGFIVRHVSLATFLEVFEGGIWIAVTIVWCRVQILANVFFQNLFIITNTLQKYLFRTNPFLLQAIRNHLPLVSGRIGSVVDSHPDPIQLQKLHHIFQGRIPHLGKLPQRLLVIRIVKTSRHLSTHHLPSIISSVKYLRRNVQEKVQVADYSLGHVCLAAGGEPHNYKHQLISGGGPIVEGGGVVSFGYQVGGGVVR
mmetsp:Transcript_44109/g.64828  ORF Transcript_44109/g.64828 Transcript_44109/m.64828 type:complete len:234 (-) Transcript_44109:330-1031(-)